MPKMNVPPTKSMLLKVKRDLSFAAEGYELLDQKRQILVMELMSRLDEARAVQRDVDDVMSEAHASLRKALVAQGSSDMQRESLGITGTYEAGVTSSRVMGIHVPDVTVTVKPLAPEFAPGAGPVQSDDVMKSFRKALDAVGRLAEVENAVTRLSRELRKTQRRVNALEKIFLPDYHETIKYITEVLEERERDGFVIMKMTKERLEKRAESAGD
jgi:V/A-type H+-transporting ATPase subunit D